MEPEPLVMVGALPGRGAGPLDRPGARTPRTGGGLRTACGGGRRRPAHESFPPPLQIFAEFAIAGGIRLDPPAAFLRRGRNGLSGGAHHPGAQHRGGHHHRRRPLDLHRGGAGGGGGTLSAALATVGLALFALTCCAAWPATSATNSTSPSPWRWSGRGPSGTQGAPGRVRGQDQLRGRDRCLKDDTPVPLLAGGGAGTHGRAARPWRPCPA